MKVIHEDIDNLERYIGNKRVDIHAELPLIMADAYSDSKNRQEAIDKLLKGDKKEPEIEITNNTVLGAEKQPVPKMPEMAKVNLEESLFEDYDDYGDFFAPDIRDAMSNLKDAFAQVAYIVSSADFDFDDAFADYPYPYNSRTLFARYQNTDGYRSDLRSDFRYYKNHSVPFPNHRA